MQAFLFAVVFALLTSTSANTQAQEVTCQIEKLVDWGLHHAGLPTPKPEALDFKTIDARAIAPYFSEQVKFREAIVQGDFAGAQDFWNTLRMEPDATARMRQLYAMHFAIDGKGLYFLSQAQAWANAQPNSMAAKAFLGLVYSDAARSARGANYYGQTSRYAMVLFKQRAAKAREILEPLLAKKDIYAASANISLLLGYFLQGMDEKAWRAQEDLINAAPGYGFGYFWAAAYTEAIWAKADVSARRADHLRKLAIANQLPKNDSLVLEQELNYRMRGIARSGNPQEARPYWMQRNKEATHLFNTLGWLIYERQMENWPEVVRLADLAIAANPLQTYSYVQRAVANKAMSRIDTIFKDTLAAAVLGNDGAMSDIVQGHVRGTLGFAPGNFNQMLAYCNMGVTFGLPSAANCMGSSFTEGFAGVKRNDQSAAAWHLLAAKGGHSNSQHDIGVLLPKFSKLPEAPSISQHWMREAARQQHVYASQKATKEPEPEIDTQCATQLAKEAALAKVKKLFKP